MRAHTAVTSETEFHYPIPNAMEADPHFRRLVLATGCGTTPVWPAPDLQAPERKDTHSAAWHACMMAGANTHNLQGTCIAQRRLVLARSQALLLCATSELHFEFSALLAWMLFL